MRGHFSIEWMAQSSQQQQQAAVNEDVRLPPATTSVQNYNHLHHQAFGVSGLLRASGTHPSTLPGSYCRQQQRETQHEGLPHEGLHVSQGHGVETSPLLHHRNHCDDLLHIRQTAASSSELGFSSGTEEEEEEETSGYESERSLSPTVFGLSGVGDAGSGGAAGPGSPLSSSSPSPPGRRGAGSPCTAAPPPSSTSTCPEAAAADTAPQHGRRPRTAFTAEQISSLERAFKRNAYLGTQDKAELCSKLSLSDKQVRNWFQNRRMKLKRTVQDTLAHACQANMASQLLHYPELQAAAAAAAAAAAYRPGHPYTPRYLHPVAHSDGPSNNSPSSYLHCLPYGSSATTSAATATAAAAATLDPYYPYAGLPGVLLTSGTTAAAQMMAASYQTLPQQY